MEQPDNGHGDGHAKAALISRLATMAQAAREADPAWTFGWQRPGRTRLTDDDRLAQALTRLDVVPASTLNAVVDETAKPHSPLAGGIRLPSRAFGDNIADFIIRSSFSPSRPDELLPVEDANAILLDPVAFRDVLVTYPQFDPLSAVKDAVGLTSSESLAVEGAERYGFESVQRLLQVAAANYVSQWSVATASLKGMTGRAEADAYGEAVGSIRSMTAPLARVVLKRRPGIDELVGMMTRNRFAALGITPPRFAEDNYRTELSKLARWTPQPVSRRLPPRIAGWVSDSHIYLVPWRDTGRIAAEAGARIRTVGAPNHQHIVTRGRARRIRWQARILPALVAVAFLAFVFLVDESTGEQAMTRWAWLFEHPASAVGIWLVPPFGGMLVGLGLASLSEFRERAFDGFAAERGSLEEIGDVRRERSFLQGLRALRPRVLGDRRRWPLPRTFTIATETDGLVIYGRGDSPQRVAAFHWLNVVAVTPASPRARDITLFGDRRYRFEIQVKHGVETLSLPCSIRRAKVDYATESSAWQRPFPTFVHSLDTGGTRWTTREWSAPEETGRRFRMMRSGATLAGTPYEREVVDYEDVSRESPVSPSRVRYRKRVSTNIPLMLVITAASLLAPSAIAAM